VRFEVSAHGPVVGLTGLPGDSGLTLTLMAFGMLSAEPVALVNPSPSPDVKRFREFLEQEGAEFQDSPDGFSMRGGLWRNDLSIGDDVPDAVLHVVVSGAVFSGKTVSISEIYRWGTERIGHFYGVLRQLGLSGDHVVEDDSGITIKGAEYVPAESVTVRSARAFETVAAAAMASRSSVTLSYQPQIVSHSVRLLSMLGYRITTSETAQTREAELARRMARASGEPTVVTYRFDLTGGAVPAVSIPGDTVLAAALSGAAAVIQKSDVTIEDVLWEQGRRGFFDALRRMKGDVTTRQHPRNDGFESADVRIGWGKLESIHLTSGQAHMLTTELVILGALAAFAEGETVISDPGEGAGIGRDAFISLSRGLEMLGAHVGDYADGIVVKGTRELRGNLVDSCGYPHVALAFALAGLNSSGTTTVFGYEKDRYPVSEFMSIIETLSK